MKLGIFAAIAAAAAVAFAACGGGNNDSKSTTAGPTAAELRNELRNATASTVADFPAVRGRTLQQVADGIGATGPEVGLATSVLTPGENRLAFGIIDRKTGFVYGKTAVYVAPKPDAKAQGPYPAPADLLVTEPAYRSQTAATEKDPFAAIYQTRVSFTKPGNWSVLAVTAVGRRLVAAPAAVKVVAKDRDPVPNVGQKALVVDTDTLQSAGGNIKAIDTRLPADDMHRVNFRDVVGTKPVALLFATPQLCQSRVCGPVVDIAAQLESKYRGQMQFIHQEVYVDNDVKKGLRAPLRRYGLPSEPWLFTINRNGQIAARLEGSFGQQAFEQAVRAALR